LLLEDKDNLLKSTFRHGLGEGALANTVKRNKVIAGKVNVILLQGLNKVAPRRVRFESIE
jgi:hypothetical protein